ncbi:PREDICTED: F-box only protein 39-like [Dinoponera quadriceps]|uniref:F-box only protein 39-like n=1 Tax=Dinoponera quadriceps TaxID=609295 RepID=A0A6P3X0R0_DINQU|nr:PREDICTED: F-box only protein 39-like [Dinoponera quadriceps]
MWDQLPELILTQIFGHLDHADRASVGEVCPAWNRALSSPVLWRSVAVVIDRDLSDDFPPATILTTKYGQHMRSLELAFSRPYISPRSLHRVKLMCSAPASAGADFLAIVRAKDVQLRQLTLTNWAFAYNRGTLLNALARFLRGQRNLETLCLLNAEFGVADVLRVLGVLAKESREHLASLDLRGAFRMSRWQVPHDNRRYLGLLSHFHSLSLLKLDYPALSNHVLYVLASNASKTLKNLHIFVRNSDSRQHMLADTAWRNLSSACPDLTVSYTIVNISHYEDIYYLLLPSLPLAKFHMFSGHVWDQSRSRNFRSTIGLLITQYTNTLVEVMLQLRNNRESLDDLLVSMLIRCKRLVRLQYDGIIRSLETLREICQLQVEHKTRFKTIHVKPRDINIQNRAVLYEINYQYDRKMHEQGIDFRVEDPTSILFFY